jgi:hypothetical protein
MPRNNNLPAEEKKSKPKSIAEIKFTVRDDGTIAGDFCVWEVDELDRRKKWTVSGEDAVKFVHRLQPRNLKSLAALINVQCVLAGLPEHQGPWVTLGKDGKMSLVRPTEKIGMGEIDTPRSTSPVGNGQGEKLAERAEARESEEIGLPKDGG